MGNEGLHSHAVSENHVVPVGLRVLGLSVCLFWFELH